ncbi:MAG: ABC transporter permease, partial [Candidatus Hydrogenedentes bacterium]|nr:ABC transporter permease [Candidatus Hydrogenedentota bacterium]
DIDKDDVIRSISSLAGLTAEEQQFFNIKDALLGNSRWLSPHVEGTEPPEEILLPVSLAREFLKEPADGAQAVLSREDKDRIANAMIGQKVHMLGRQFEVIGVYDWEKMNQLIDIDGERLTPFDPVEMEKKFQEEGTPDPESVQRYIHHSFKDVAVVNEQVLGNLGGELRSVALLPNSPKDLTPLLENLVRRLDYILFANLDGVPTLLSSRNATRISEMWNLLILMIIAGLIVFNTMLGSVFERTKEIGTYTALGIAPSHIGRLFMVEAGVFAVLGVMAGYVAGQTISRLAHVLSIPLLNTLELNYSSLAGVAACLLVMGMVLLSSIYPARKASELGVPDIERRWKLPPTKEARITLQLPFTVSMNEAPGLVAFLKEYLDSHVDVSVGNFYVEEVQAGPAVAGGAGTGVTARFWLTPFDLWISQFTTITLRELEDMKVCGVEVAIERLSGDASSWRRAISVKRMIVTHCAAGPRPEPATRPR